jgi:hypothetical protein
MPKNQHLTMQVDDDFITKLDVLVKRRGSNQAETLTFLVKHFKMDWMPVYFKVISPKSTDSDIKIT